MYWLACNINRTSNMLSTNSTALTCGKVPTLPSNKDSSGYLSGQIKIQFKCWFLTPLKTVLVSGKSTAMFQPRKGCLSVLGKKGVYFSLWATPCYGEAPPNENIAAEGKAYKMFGRTAHPVPLNSQSSEPHRALSR